MRRRLLSISLPPFSGCALHVKAQQHAPPALGPGTAVEGVSLVPPVLGPTGCVFILKTQKGRKEAEALNQRNRDALNVKTCTDGMRRRTWQTKGAGGAATHLALIWEAIVRKAFSTLVEFLALVSRKAMPKLSANSCRHDDNKNRLSML